METEYAGLHESLDTHRRDASGLKAVVHLAAMRPHMHAITDRHCTGDFTDMLLTARPRGLMCSANGVARHAPQTSGRNQCFLPFQLPGRLGMQQGKNSAADSAAPMYRHSSPAAPQRSARGRRRWRALRLACKPKYHLAGVLRAAQFLGPRLRFHQAYTADLWTLPRRRPSIGGCLAMRCSRPNGRSNGGTAKRSVRRCVE